ncbi:hypothetical protein RCH07_002631 [Arthrobacter sp. CG_A4]|nr:hypothetical protein [Arthrobacter sp. CG_A4]
MHRKRVFVHTQGPETLLTCGNTVPEVGLEPGSSPCKAATPPQTSPIRPSPAPVRPSPRPKVWTLSTPPDPPHTRPPPKLPHPRIDRVRRFSVLPGKITLGCHRVLPALGANSRAPTHDALRFEALHNAATSLHLLHGPIGRQRHDATASLRTPLRVLGELPSASAEFRVALVPQLAHSGPSNRKLVAPARSMKNLVAFTPVAAGSAGIAGLEDTRPHENTIAGELQNMAGFSWFRRPSRALREASQWQHRAQPARVMASKVSVAKPICRRFRCLPGSTSSLLPRVHRRRGVRAMRQQHRDSGRSTCSRQAHGLEARARGTRFAQSGAYCTNRPN